MIIKFFQRSLFLIFFFMVLFPLVVFAGGKFAPPEDKVLLVIGQNTKALDDYVKAVKIIPAGFMIYTSIQNADGLRGPVDYGAGTNDAMYLAEKYPGTVFQLGLYMVGILDDIDSGNYDSNIDEIGRWISEINRPVYLRIGYEFDFRQNNYEPEKYVKAYKHIVDRLRKNGVKNAAYVWHSHASYISKPLMDWYPGDEYVDWFAISYFNQPQKYMKEMSKLAKEHNKPFMIAEATPAHIGVTPPDKAYHRWYKYFFDFILKENVDMVCYINNDWDSLSLFASMKWKDSRVEKNKKMKSIWLKEIRSEKYIQRSENLFRDLGYVPAQ